MEKNDFIYFLHGSQKNNTNDLLNIMDVGLKNYYGTSMHSTMTELDDEANLQEEILSYEGSFASVVVIKIPRSYLGGYHKQNGQTVIHKANKEDSMLPIFKEMKTSTEEYHLLPSNFIQGIHVFSTGKSITNPKFSPIYNPNGLQYADEQRDLALSCNNVVLAEYIKQRRQHSYDVLKKFDEKYKTFDDITKNYQIKFEK